MAPKFRSALENLAPYPPGKPIEEVQREYGLADIVKLASNENPLGPSPLAVKAARKELAEAHLYPESACHYLRQKLSQRLAIAPESLMFGNGSDEIVAMLALAYLEPEMNIVCSDLAFVRYSMGATMMGAETRFVPMRDWKHDPDAMIAAVDDSTRFVFFDNPNNPVGTGITQTQVEHLLSSVSPDVLVVIDEAYYEFARGEKNYPDSLALQQRFPNLIILRTFSKAFGLAGLRVGYGIAAPEIWGPVDCVRPPFNVNRIAQAAAVAALDDERHVARTVRNNTRGRKYLYREFKRLGFDYVPTQANFIIFDARVHCGELYEKLLRRGVIVRPMAMYNLPTHLRVSIGRPQENEKFIDALSREAVIVTD